MFPSYSPGLERLDRKQSDSRTCFIPPREKIFHTCTETRSYIAFGGWTGHVMDSQAGTHVLQECTLPVKFPLQKQVLSTALRPPYCVCPYDSLMILRSLILRMWCTIFLTGHHDLEASWWWWPLPTPWTCRSESWNTACHPGLASPGWLSSLTPTHSSRYSHPHYTVYAPSIATTTLFPVYFWNSTFHFHFVWLRLYRIIFRFFLPFPNL